MKLRCCIGLIIVAMVGNDAMGEFPGPIHDQIPIMPPRMISYTPSTKSRVRRSRQRSSFLAGFEVGTLGQRNSTTADVLGLKLLLGGRLFAVFPVSRDLYLKPTIGFFFKNQDIGKPSVTQFLAEAGLNIQYRLSKSSGFTWLLGVAQKAQADFSRISVGPISGATTTSSASETSPLLFRYRIGPTLGFTYQINRDLGLLADFEVSFTFTQPIHSYVGLVSGLIFKF